MNNGTEHTNFEGRAVYERMIEVFFYSKPNKDLKKTVHPEFMGYGTAAHEFFRNRVDVTEMAKLQSEQLRNQKVEIQRKPILEKVFAKGTSCLIMEEFDMYFKDTKHHLVARLSTILERIDGEWLVTHFHGSTPDSNIAEDEAFPLEGLRKKNEELEAKIKERTRELEIEAALERVRAKTMSIQHQDELLDVITLLADQLVHLGIDLDSANFSNGLSQKKGWDIWIYNKHFQPDMRTSRVFYPWFDHPMFHAVEALIKDYKKGIDLNVAVFNKEQLKIFVDYVFTETVYKDAEDKDSIKEAFYKVPGYTWTVICLKDTWVSMNRFNTTPFTDEENAIFRRFANAFGQAYTRFLDLQKAEAQAREAQIEAALERARTQSMLMQHSDELYKTSEVFHEQLHLLGIESEFSYLWLPDEEKSEHLFWATWQESNKKATFRNKYVTFPLDKSEPSIAACYVAWDSDEAVHVNPVAPDEVEEYFNTWPDLLDDIEKFKPELFPDGLYYIDAYMKYGCFGVMIRTLLSDEQKQILRRFSKEFERAYTRFLDLQKAEAQARESMIQLSLERVRAKAMAMQSTDDLGDVLCVLFEQFDFLGIHPVLTHLTLFDEENDTFSLRVTTNPENKVLVEQIIDVEAVENWKNSYENWKKGGSHTVDCIEYTPESLPAVWEVLHEVMTALPEEHQIHPSDFPNGLFTTQGHCKYGYIGFNHSRPATEEEKTIVARFADEFGIVYQRFLELQKAEAQAREAQVEAALERVRSRSLAMHKSEELNEVVAVIFEKLKELKIPATAVGIGIYIDGSKDLNSFVCGENEEGLVITNYRLPYFNNKISKDLCNANEKQVDFFVGQYSKQVKNNFYQYLLDHTPEFKHLPEDIKSMIFESPSYTITMVVVNHAVFNINDFEGKVLSNDNITIIKRFARVFDQAYTRFEDLQKAEAQTRAAQIEASLERVRAKSMAMHDSDELNDVLSVLFQQFDVLGIQPVTVFLSLFDIKNNTFTYRSTSKAGTRMQSQQVVNLDALDIWKEMAEKWQNDTVDSIEEIYYPKAVLPDLFRLFEETFSAMPKKERLTAADFPDGGYAVHGYCKFGYLGFNHDRPGTEEEKNILLKFAKEFERIYQRFLDIQKAEAQTRQAQINLGVERVRAKALAMHKSEEIIEVVAKLKDEVMSLDIPDVIAATIFLKEGEDKVRMWDLSSLQKLDGVYQSPLDITFKLKKTDPHLYPKRVWENPDNYFVEIQDTKGFKRILAWLREHGKHEVANETEAFIESTQLKQLYHVAKKLNSGKLVIDLLNPPSDEMETILTKMGAAFDLAYKRFEDLQKAEAQAREAQIEVALERVRARTMAMQRSEELAITNTLVVEQINLLINSLFAVGIHICHSEKPMSDAWIGDPVEGQMPYLVFDHSKDPFAIRIYREWKNGNPFHFETLEGKDLIVHFRFMATQIPNREAFDPRSFPSKLTFHLANFSTGFLVFVTTEECPQEHDIFKRFAKVFEQTYTRFLDIQKAEAQAREAEIETALEKVRSRTMAMHKSEELAETALVLYEQFKALGNIPDRMSIGIFKEETKEIELWATDQFGSQLNKRFRGFWKQSAVWTSFYKAWKSGDDSFVVDLSGQKLKTWLKFIREEIKLFVDDSNIKGRRVQQAAFFSHGMLLFTTNEPVTEEIMQLLVRFAKVFSQTYTRFLDLQKAEAQTREAQIEGALERVRSKTMAMHNSKDLEEIVISLFDEVLKLGIDKSIRCGIGILEGHEGMETRSVNKKPDGTVELRVGMLNMTIHPMLVGLKKAWKKGSKEYSYDYTEKDVRKYYETLNKEPEYPFNANLEKLPKQEFHKSFFYSSGILFAFSENPITEGSAKILARFAAVFGQTYRRFLDLENAEKQAREAQIEAALEKVRSRSLAMHKSNEMQQVANEVYEQLKTLSLEMDVIGMSGVIETKSSYEVWVGGSEFSKPLIIPYTDSTKVQRDYNKAIKKRLELFARTYTGKVKEEYIDFLLSENDFPEPLKTVMLTSKAFSTSLSFAKNSGIQIARYTNEPYTEEENNILIRFSKVFEQAYIRFMDLKKAEAQVRESQIEAALERVRAQTMAMHNSEDVAAAVKTMFDQLTLLGLSPAVRCGIGTFDDSDYMELWTASTDPTGKVRLDIGTLDMRLHPLLIGFKKAWKDKQPFYEHKKLSGKEVREYFEIINNSPGYTFKTDLEKLPAEIYHYDFMFAQGAVFVFSPNPLSPDLNEIFDRFTKVFQQTYTRFLDLQKAEAQAREAEIELSLERIRAQAMAMTQSSDLLDIVVTMRSEFIKLGHEAHYFWHMRWQPDGYVKAMTSGDGTRIGTVMELPRDFHSHYKGMTEWENSKEPVMILALETEIAVDYIGKMITQGNFQQVDPNAPTLDDVRHIGGITFVMARTTHGEIGYSLPGVVKNPPVEDLNILERFAGVFDLAHRRFEDLIKAEAREKEAIKQSSLDRVRAEIASMRTTDDLDRITPLVWRELTALGVPFFRCGIFIIREEEEMVHAYLSTPSGDRLAALHIGFDEQEVGLVQPAIVNWRKQEIYSEEWDQERFIQNMGTFMKQGIIKSPKKYQDGETPPEKLVLQLVPFKQGMLYAGNSEQLIPEHIELMKELAKAFSAAYSRYEDFNELEHAKSKVEVALTDLKSTQNQLVQSEKMASLGELTAGIAHEIQNPLNFVNNFSEVSKELIEEMMEEMGKGDMEEVKAIADDVVQNLEKINHHGKRADGIVKGMLQHSRTSSGEKELTDINVLTDEYLRLAYHGLRAKDKSFNATLETHFDQSIGKVNVLTQDMGRVILNLITNAFYAVKEKKEQQPEGYAPTVTVSTEKTTEGVFIKVSDNGNGIPEAIKEKIFQPFFTTKPTGQGTGLGLSMSYDIVTKGHGGELKVTSKEGVGTTFTIVLPIVKNTKSKKK